MRLTLLLLMALTHSVHVHAALEWNPISVELKARPGQSSVDVEFFCRNTGEGSARTL